MRISFMQFEKVLKFKYDFIFVADWGSHPRCRNLHEGRPEYSEGVTDRYRHIIRQSRTGGSHRPYLCGSLYLHHWIPGMLWSREGKWMHVAHSNIIRNFILSTVNGLDLGFRFT